MRTLISFIFLLLVGCAVSKEPEVGMGDIHVPKAYHPALNWIDRAPSHYERYLTMFRDGYWDCVQNYVKDINYTFQKSDSYANGWMSEVAGYGDGYNTAERDMQRNIKNFGKQRTAKYLKGIWEAGG